TSDAYGRYSFFTPPGRFRLKISKSAVIDREDTIQVPAPETAVEIDGEIVDTGSAQEVAGDKEFSGTVTVSGTLLVTGTTTIDNIELTDPILILNSDFTTGVPSENGGLTILRG